MRPPLLLLLLLLLSPALPLLLLLLLPHNGCHAAVIPLTRNTQRLYTMPITLSVGGSPTAAAPTLVVDTGSSYVLALCCRDSDSGTRNTCQGTSTLPACSSLGQLSSVGLLIDGETFSLSAAVVGQSDPIFRMRLDALGTTFSTLHSLISGSPSTGPSEKYWANTDGTLGVAPGNLRLNIDQGNVPLGFYFYTNTISLTSFALNLRGSVGSSFVTGSDIDTEGVVFSEPLATTSADLFVARIFHPTMCSVDLLQGVSSNWISLIDTGARCLGMPGEVFDQFLVQSGVQCNVESSGEYICQEGSTPLSQVDHFRFQLSEKGTQFAIDFQSLVYTDPDRNNMQRVCIFRKSSVYPPKDLTSNNVFSYFTSSSSFTFGSMVMENFYSIYETENVRVGLRSTFSPPSNFSPTCPTPVTCTGDQTYHAGLNRCDNPNCSSYFFQELDEDTKTCGLSLSFKVGLFTVIGILALLEIVLFEFYSKLSVSLKQRMLQQQEEMREAQEMRQEMEQQQQQHPHQE